MTVDFATFGRADSDASAKRAATQLEAFFIRRMLAEMRAGLGESKLLGGGHAGKMFQEMLDEAMADEMSAAGGMGIADMVEVELSEHKPAQRAAGGAMGYARVSAPLQRHPLHEAQVSSDFGQRIHPVSHERSFHTGLDLAAPKGAAVSSVGDGTVIRAERAGSYGNLVVVDHGGGVETRYAHLDEIAVQRGARVRAGESIGTVGESGRATGPHLHLEVRRQGQAVDPADEIPGLTRK